MVLVGTTRPHTHFSKCAFLGRSLPIHLHLLNSDDDIRSALRFKRTKAFDSPFTNKGDGGPKFCARLSFFDDCLVLTVSPLGGDLGNLNLLRPWYWIVQ